MELVEKKNGCCQRPGDRPARRSWRSMCCIVLLAVCFFAGAALLRCSENSLILSAEVISPGESKENH